ncbi:6-phosphogluconolactonase [Thermomonas sp.]|uniref:6-phosphogluconolactonase n=1 Tax=Thermomonas sp. TaxID=1971895 RepID=UPI0039E673F8
MGWIEHDHADTGALVAQVSAAFETACRSAIRERGQTWLALAGGRTPLPVYAHLAHAGLDGVVSAIPTDERCVPHDHAACNLRNLRDAFDRHSREGGNPWTLDLQKAKSLDSRLRGNDELELRGNDDKGYVQQPRTNIIVNAITREDGDVEASLAQARALLALNPQPFDAVLLGMGADGHFASLFPGAANLAEGLAQDSGLDAIATLPDPLPPEAPFARISLTLPRLLRARDIHLVVTGEDKRRILRDVQRDAAAPYPVAALLHAGPQIHIHWSP